MREIRALERALQFLRPLVSNKTWDYCVVWEFGDDPSRFIEWVGCCCSGSCSDEIGAVKEEKGELQHKLISSSCRDTFINHPPKTKACRALADFPSSMPLYSGIHGEAVMSVEPKWHSSSSSKESSPNQSEESSGTHVLIPVVGGLIELFSSKNIPKDKKILESITSQYNTIVDKEGVNALSLLSSSVKEPPHESFLEGEYSLCSDYTPKLPLLPLVSNPSFARTSKDSSPSISSVSVHESLTAKQELAVSGRVKNVAENDGLKCKPKKDKEKYHSKNLITERNRRQRIKKGMYTLRSLVPNITKMDKASILGDAVDYIKQLQIMEKNLHDELNKTEETSEVVNPEEPEPKPRRKETQPAAAKEKIGSNTDEIKQVVIELDVKQIGPKSYLLKFLCYQKRGGFMMLMEAVTSLGLQVTHANVTTLHGKVNNILTVEVNNSAVQPKMLRDSLIRALGKPLKQ